MTTTLWSVAVAVNYHVLNKEYAYFICGDFDLVLEVRSQLADTAGPGEKRDTTYGGAKGY
jgi:hypothetical protein